MDLRNSYFVAKVDRDAATAVATLKPTDTQSPADATVYAQRQSVQHAPRRREYGLDWLRVIAFTLLIVYHSGMFFVPWPWTIKNPEVTQWLTWPMLFLNRWRLPLIFFISGAGTWFNLQRRDSLSFAWERVVRLLLPFAVGIFLIAPPQTYFVLKVMAWKGLGSYFGFWASLFTSVPRPYPEGGLQWHHLWFLPYLFVFSLAGLPLLMLIRSQRGRAIVDRIARLCERPGFIYLLNIPNFVAAGILIPHWPLRMNLVSDWANFVSSLLTFLLGFIICGSDRFLSLLEHRRLEFTYVAGALSVVFVLVRLEGALAALSPVQQHWIITLVDSYLTLSMILALVGWSRAKLNHDSPALRYTNSAVYPFYIIHQTVTVALGYAWLGWHAPFAVKFPLLCAGTFVASWMFYEIVRRTRVTRMLFGMRP